MADFSTSQISTGSLSVPSPQQGVASGSGNNAVALAGLFGGAVEGYLANDAKEKAQEQASAQAGVLADFQQQQLDIADAVESGQMTSAQGRRRMRDNYSRALTNNPSLAEDFGAAHKTIIGTSGLGKVVAEGTEEEQQFFEMRKTGLERGWVRDGMSEDEQREALDNMVSFDKAQEELAASTAKLSNARAKVGLQRDKVGLSTAYINQSKAKLDLANAKHENTIKQSFGTMTSVGVGRFRQTVQTISQQVQEGKMTPEEAQFQIDQERITMTAGARQLAQQSGTVSASAFASTIDDIANTNIKYITGEINLEQVERANKLALATEQNFLLQDPDVQRVVAASELFKNNPVALDNQAQTAATKVMSMNIPDSPTPGKPLDPAGTEGDTKKALHKNLTQVQDSINRGRTEMTPNLRTEMDNNLTSVIGGMAKYGDIVEDASEIKDEVAFFASDEFAAMFKDARVNKETATKAKNSMKAVMEGTLVPLVKQEWEKRRTITGTAPQPTQATARGRTPATATSQARSEIVMPRVGGDGLITFQATVDSPEARSAARDLNKRVAAPVNRLAKAQAHLDGNSSYSKYTQEYLEIFEVEETTDAGED